MGFLDIFKRKPSYEELKEKALALEAEKDYLGAAAIWERIAEHTPDPLATYRTVAENLSRFSAIRNKQPEWFYKAVLITPDDSPDCSEIERKYGEALMECGRYDEAEFQFIIAQDVDSNNWNVHFSFGKLHEKLGEKNLAIGYYTKDLSKCIAGFFNLENYPLRNRIIGGKVPETPSKQEAYRTDTASKALESKPSDQNQDPVGANPN